jgi:ribosomal protein S18 acetylase RimI-like enzyme
MIYTYRTNIYKIPDYSRHLKNLTDEDKISRFGYLITDYMIDKLILDMCYHPSEHELWYARTDDTRVGWGHLARNPDGSWELAVSVDREHQRQGIGNKLIAEMLEFAKFNSITEIYMHCIEENRAIQHLAEKHQLKTRERGAGERTASLEVPGPTFVEANSQLWKEQTEILKEMGKLRNRLTNLWTKPILPK